MKDIYPEPIYWLSIWKDNNKRYSLQYFIIPRYYIKNNIKPYQTFYKILKEANTLEELCNQYIWTWYEYSFKIQKPIEVINNQWYYYTNITNPQWHIFN